MRPSFAALALALALTALTSMVHAAGGGSAPRTLDEAVRQLHDPTADASRCRALPAERGEARWECSSTECPGACQVVHLVTVLGERRGRYRQVSQERQRRGDTGECGCCM